MPKPVNYISRFVRWILPLLALLLIVLCLVVSPIALTHAAATHQVVVPHQTAPEVAPDAYWPIR